jgi:gas vesicle protein
MGKHKEQPNMKDATKKFAVGAVVAAAAGYVAGILTAPKSGKETRQDIKEASVKTVNEAEKQLKRLHTELSDVIAEGSERANRLTGKAKQELEVVLAATDVVKGKAREILSAVHEGRADDKELEKAIKDAKTAIAHLKTYLKKRQG